MQSQPTKEKRFTLNRYFYKMGKGWYVEAREGLQGPFLKRGDAEFYLETIKKDLSWSRE